MDEIDREWADWNLDEDELDMPDDDELEGGAGVREPADPDDPDQQGGAAVALDRDLVLV